MKMIIPAKDAQDLESAGILTAFGASGQKTTMTIAAQMPEICVIKSSAGDTYNVAFNGTKFTLTQI